MATAETSPISPTTSGPAWPIATLFPDQGDLSEYDYLFLTEHTNRLAEFSDGVIEVLPMPTAEHQEIVLFLVNLLRAFITPPNLGRALMVPLRVKLRNGRFREPDIMFMLQQNISRASNRFWLGADLVMEVVSDDDPDRDLVQKRLDYAEAGISEYWIVDPRTQSITVLKLSGNEYALHGEFKPGDSAASVLLPGFRADVSAVFAAGRAGQ